MMTQLPERFQSYIKEAEILFKKGGVGELEFSGGTYQVEIKDPNFFEPCWAFLQFDEKNRLSDCFCSCEANKEPGSCLHLAVAYFAIFKENSAPLHVRFNKSLWNLLFFYFYEEFGDDLEILKQKGKDCFVLEKGEKELFAAKALNLSGRKYLQKVFLERRMETEETSLKFSNLSQEEIKLWRQGRPGFHLRYELSFWNDLAKWLMLLEEKGEKGKIDFSYGQEALPISLSAFFPMASFSFSLTTKCLEKIIPALAKVSSPLKLFGSSEDAIDKIVFDERKKELRVIENPGFKKEKEKLGSSQITFGEWIYLPKKGFYSRKCHPLLDQGVFQGAQIGEVLDRYYSVVKLKLKGTRIFEKPKNLSYKLCFDSLWNLHIEAYLFEPGDLTKQSSSYFGDWAFVENKGLIHLENSVFKKVQTVVSENEIREFIKNYRLWLTLQEGFQPHITGVETKLLYSVTEESCLLFTRSAVFEDGSLKIKDFGPWVYVEGKGFFPKASSAAAASIRSGVAIKRDQVPLFIRMYKEELGQIAGFFSERCPVEKAGLKVFLTDAGTVSVEPEYKMLPEYSQKRVRFFEDYTYVQGEGFYKIPAEILLPERFRHSIQLEKSTFPRFFSYEMEKINASVLWIDPRLKPAEHLQLSADSLSRHSDGYLLKLAYKSKGASVGFSELFNAEKKGERYLFSEAGLIDLSEPRFNWLRRVKEKSIDTKTNTITLSTLEMLYVMAFDKIQVKAGKELIEELQEFQISEMPSLKGLKSRLRPYQEIGVKWMWFLFKHRLCGLLCDDMGLGKTHQAMALMAAICASSQKKVHILVVCPTSVIYHWEEKLEEYLPKLKVCTFHGSKRSFEDFHKEYDILLTSYGIWRNECSALSKTSFELAVFDEIQAAKNQASRLHHSLLKVNARIRIGLTGTPIENRLRELKSLFDIILPGYMPKEAEYRDFFVTPIEKEQDASRKKLLSKFIKPFVLRRKKEVVLSDLPEKTEEIAYCELTFDQKILYNDLLGKFQKGIFHDLAEPDTPIPYMHVFSLLSSLKQVCNHPAAFLKKPENYEQYSSGKWDLFVELLEESLESGQKVVVFSQYLAMLDIFERFLQKRKIEYASIRGATLKRGEEIQRFNQKRSCEVFIGSLHAAGLGIDLTAASVVIHYDRWWNAAREDQATDRVHRIGQQRGVQVFKLVAKGTFEEKIDAMITRKGELMEDVVGVDDWRFMKRFNREEIMQLFREVSE